MEEYRKHVLDERTSNIEKIKKSFCGEYIQDFAFTGTDHVVSNNQSKGRLLPCEKCRDKIVSILMDESL